MGLGRRRALIAAGLGLACAVAPAAGAGEGEDRDQVIAAAAERGCVAREVKRLGAPHQGVIEVRCADSHVIWFEKVDGAWVLKPLG
ncbi:MAG TPA: hypothetical protein VGB88_12745 [Alphaproteobacteria bacterium]